jgi:hypothetical protein
MKFLDSKRLNELINELMSGLEREDCIDDEEYRLFLDLKALPIGFSLYSYVFISPTGEVLSTDLEPGEISRENSERHLISILAWGAERYLALRELIREQPEDAEICPLCRGEKIYGTWIGTNDIATCVHCNGLGWVLKETS